MAPGESTSLSLELAMLVGMDDRHDIASHVPLHP
jgi:hypothetical protein